MMTDKLPFWPEALPSRAAIGFNFAPDMSSREAVYHRLRPWVNKLYHITESVDFEVSNPLFTNGGVGWLNYKVGFDHQRFVVETRRKSEIWDNNIPYFKQLGELDKAMKEVMPLFLEDEERQLLRIGFVIEIRGILSDFPPFLRKELEQAQSFLGFSPQETQFNSRLNGETGEVSSSNHKFTYSLGVLANTSAQVSTKEAALKLDFQYHLTSEEPLLVGVEALVALKIAFYECFLKTLRELEQ